MALAATTVWEVRTTGDDLNGGGFNAARGGVDYTQQDSPQATGTVTVSGTTCTATTGIFTSAMVGNIITNGTFYREITAYISPTAVTIDATVAWTSASIRVGGALATLGKALGFWVNGNLIWITGSHSQTYQITISGATSGALFRIIRGYGAVRGDNSKATITAASGINMATISGMVILENLLFDGNNIAPEGIVCSTSTDRGTTIRRCAITRTQGRGIAAANALVDMCEVYSLHASATAGIVTDGTGNSLIKHCLVRDLSCPGFRLSTSGQNMTAAFLHSVVTRCTVGYDLSSALFTTKLIGCVSHGNTSHGVQVTSNQAIHICDSIFTSNGGYGINLIAGTPAEAYGAESFAIRNAFYLNTSGARNNLAVSPNDITLTGNPFVNAAGNDFRLNNIAGAGMGLRGVIANTPMGADYHDFGPLQHQEIASGGLRLPIGFAGGFAP